jgi:phospholipase D-like protein
MLREDGGRGVIPTGRCSSAVCCRCSRAHIHRRRKVRDVLAADYPFLDILWTMIIFFGFVIWIYLLVMVLGDNFRRRDHSGWSKAGWTLFVIFLPLLGVLVYMIARPPEESTMYA